MSAPGGGPLDAEPSVQIRRSLAHSASGTGYGGVSASGSSNSGFSAPPPDPAEPSNSINSVTTTSGGSGGGGFNLFRRTPKPDKAPLLNNDRDDLMRSLSGSTLPATPSSGGRVERGRRDGLNTFSGVFAPVALSMFSVLLFLRMGYVVGFAGIGMTLGMLCLAYGIIILTVFSLCAISTNGAIEGGGVYYMISRALGPEFGGSIGTLFFLANVFANALYVSGFVEILVATAGPPDGPLPSSRWWRFLYGLGVSVIILLVCLVGAALFAKTSVLILIVVGISYASFAISLGVKPGPLNITIPHENTIVYPPLPANETANGTVHEDRYRVYTGLADQTFLENFKYSLDGAKDYSTGTTVTFALIFGIVFSGVTGIMAGANMSGELKQPNVSIPRGTIQAVTFTFCVYIVTTLLVGSSCSKSLLRNDYSVFQDINVWSGFIIIGVMCTTLFSGLSNLIGASRVLARMSEDKLFGAALNPFMYTVGGNNPIIAVIFSWVLSIAVLLIGALNTIAQITSIFFLLSYVGVNLACLALDLASAPNFRPQFRFFSAGTALVGAIGCTTMMFVVDAAMSGITIVLLMALLLALHYKAPIASWGSISQALIFHQVRKYLLLLDARKDHVKYWRPQMLLLVNSPQTCLPLIDFVNDLKKSGLYVMGHVRRGRLDSFPMDPLHQELPYWLSLVDHLSVKCFVELTVCESVRVGVEQLMRISGLGAMKPNTVILGFHDEGRAENTLQSGHMLRELKYAKLERAEVVEYFTQGPNAIEDRNETRMSVDEYVAMINDVIKLHKNLVLARHFNKLDKDLIFKPTREHRSWTRFEEEVEPSVLPKVATRRYVDVWAVDLGRCGGDEGGWNNSCLFLLQLACILHMVPGWRRRTTLRVFLCVTSLQDMQRRDRQLREMLDDLRITAKTVVVPWDHVVCHLPQGTSTNTDQSHTVPMASIPPAYLNVTRSLLRHSCFVEYFVGSKWLSVISGRNYGT